MEIKDLLELSPQCEIQVQGNDYPVLVDGQGIPCLVLGIGSLLQKSLSSFLKQQLKIYSCDAYWTTAKTPLLKDLSIDSICSDIIHIADQIGLTQYYLIGHSVFGGLVIEVAKHRPKGLLGIIGIGATPGWNSHIIQFKDNYFEQRASQQRKLRFKRMQDHYLQNKPSNDSLASIEAYYAESAKYFAQPVTQEDIKQLFMGVDCNHHVINHLFDTLLPKYSFENNLDSVDVPTLIVGGQKDYDSVPLEIWKHYPTPKRTSFLDCGPVGHWPHLEDPTTFDLGILKWLREQK